MNSPNEKRFNWALILICINLAVIYYYTFNILLSYDMSWMQYEKLKTHIWILSNGKEWHLEDWAKFLHTKIIEIDPNRLSRPLSNFIEVVDAKFRANLWDHIVPHPTLSLQWPFLFIGLPILLFRLFRNFDCHPVVALAGTALYMTSPGFLSAIVQISHPAKSMVNFFGILSMMTITQLYRFSKDRSGQISIKEIPHYRRILAFTILWTVVTFFSDETGVFLFPVLGFIGYPIYRKLKEKGLLLGAYMCLPVIYFIIIRFIMTWLHSAFSHDAADLGHYRDIPSISNLFLPDWHNLFTNFYLLFSVHPDLKWYLAPMLGHPVVLTLQCLFTVIFIGLMGIFGYTIYQKKKLSSRLLQIISGVILLLIFVFFHTFQLSHNVKTWTVFWYGCLFSLIYYVTFTLLLQYLWEEFNHDLFKKALPFILIILTAQGLMATTYMVRIFKGQSYNPREFYYPSILDGTQQPYSYFNLSETLRNNKCKYLYAKLYWASAQHRNLNMAPLTAEVSRCYPILMNDAFFRVDQLFYVIEASFEYPPGRSFLNDPEYVSAITHQEGEPL